MKTPITDISILAIPDQHEILPENSEIDLNSVPDEFNSYDWILGYKSGLTTQSFEDNALDDMIGYLFDQEKANPSAGAAIQNGDSVRHFNAGVAGGFQKHGSVLSATISPEIFSSAIQKFISMYQTLLSDTTVRYYNAGRIIQHGSVLSASAPISSSPGVFSSRSSNQKSIPSDTSGTTIHHSNTGRIMANGSGLSVSTSTAVSSSSSQSETRKVIPLDQVKPLDTNMRHSNAGEIMENRSAISASISQVVISSDAKKSIATNQTMFRDFTMRHCNAGEIIQQDTSSVVVSFGTQKSLETTTLHYYAEETLEGGSPVSPDFTQQSESIPVNQSTVSEASEATSSISIEETSGTQQNIPVNQMKLSETTKCSNLETSSTWQNIPVNQTVPSDSSDTTIMYYTTPGEITKPGSDLSVPISPLVFSSGTQKFIAVYQPKPSETTKRNFHGEETLKRSSVSWNPISSVSNAGILQHTKIKQKKLPSETPSVLPVPNVTLMPKPSSSSRQLFFMAVDKRNGANGSVSSSDVSASGIARWPLPPFHAAFSKSTGLATKPTITSTNNVVNAAQSSSAFSGSIRFIQKDCRTKVGLKRSASPLRPKETNSKIKMIPPLIPLEKKQKLSDDSVLKESDVRDVESNNTKVDHLSCPSSSTSVNRKLKYVCPYCEKDFVMKKTLICHKSLVEPLPCLHCSEEFECDGTWSRHFYKEHLQDVTNSKPACTLCSKTFHNKHNLLMHYLTHVEKRKFICKGCNSEKNLFKTPKGLQKHLEAHIENYQAAKAKSEN